MHANLRRATGSAVTGLGASLVDDDATGRDAIREAEHGTVRADVAAERTRAEQVDDRHAADGKGEQRDPRAGEIPPDVSRHEGRPSAGVREQMRLGQGASLE